MSSAVCRRVVVIPFALVSSGLTVTVAHAADITTPPNITTQTNFGGNDHITVNSGSKIEVNGSRALNQNSAATGVVIDNSGLIASTNANGRAIDMATGSSITVTLTNNSGAAVRSGGDTFRINTNITGGTVLINNSGTIESTGTNGNSGQAIDFAAIAAGTATVTINNLAGGIIRTADADAVRPGNNATINNAGQIIANNFQTNTGADAVDFQEATGGTVNNTGTISGGRHGITISLGGGNTSAASITVTNEAGGQIIGRNGSGVGSDVSGVVINRGLISGRADDIIGVPDGDGDGVDIDYIGTITNYGIIEGTGAKGFKDGLPNTSEGIAMGGGSIDNRAGATIRSVTNAILIDDSNTGPAFGAVTITNAGTIVGTAGYGIKIISNLDNTITNSGTITGGNGQAIIFGDGNDTLNIRTGSVINGSVDGGGGTNRISLSGTGTFAGATNFQTLSVDNGAWTLTGTQHSYSGGIAVAGGGELIATGTIGSVVTIASMGRVSGTGSVSGIVANSGAAVAPGNSSGIGTLSVNGNVRLDAGSTFQVGLAPQGQNGKLAATGTATINGGTVNVVANPGTYARNATYTVLNAQSGRTGTFDGITSNFAFLTPTLSYDANNVYVQLVQLSGAFAAGGRTGNQKSVGRVLDQASPMTTTGDFNTVLNALSSLNIQQGQEALEQISGQPYSAAGTVAVGNGMMFLSGFSGANNRGGDGGDTRVALAEACELDTCDDDGRTPGRWSAWFSGLGGFGSVGNGSANALTYSAGGAAAGLDYRLNEQFLVGAAIGYVGSKQWVQGFQGSGWSNSYNAALYASFAQAGFYADATVGYGWTDNHVQRVLSIPGLGTRIANGDAGGRQFLGQFETGYKIGFGEQARFSATPFARFQAVAATQDGFTETGAQSLNLIVASQNTTSLRTVLGVDLGAKMPLFSQGPLRAALRLGWSHDYADTTRPMTASFSGAPGAAFTVFGVEPRRDAAVIGLRLDTPVADRTSVYFRYDGEMTGRDDAHALSAGVRLTW